MTDVPLEHHEECACVCKDDSDWPQTCVTAANGSMRMLEMNLCRCSYLIHYHWKLTRFSFYPDVLLLIGWSRTDWNLINLPNGFDCCGIPIECSESILERPKKNHWSRSGPLPMSSEDYFLPFFWDKNTEAFAPFLPEVFFKVQSVWADTVMKNGSFFVQVLFYIYKWAGSSCLALLPWLLYYYHQGKERWFLAVSFCSPLVLPQFVCGSVQTQYSWNVTLMRLHYV